MQFVQGHLLQFQPDPQKVEDAFSRGCGFCMYTLLKAKRRAFFDG
jgi:hypothetical protein